MYVVKNNKNNIKERGGGGLSDMRLFIRNYKSFNWYFCPTGITLKVLFNNTESVVSVVPRWRKRSSFMSLTWITIKYK